MQGEECGVLPPVNEERRCRLDMHVVPRLEDGMYPAGYREFHRYPHH